MPILEPESQYPMPMSSQDLPGMTGIEGAIGAGGAPELFFWDKDGGAHLLLSFQSGGSPALVVFNEAGKPTMVSDLWKNLPAR